MGVVASVVWRCQSSRHSPRGRLPLGRAPGHLLHGAPHLTKRDIEGTQDHLLRRIVRIPAVLDMAILSPVSPSQPRRRDGLMLHAVPNLHPLPLCSPLSDINQTLR